ncbi:hypothetical protein ACFWNC_01665 [Streptomyces sp. NPDC058369]|uniref:DUF6414 family protein n=1 Tax=unclassified Streptomyces TaxID=2593676 RepID=UPI003452BE22
MREFLYVDTDKVRAMLAQLDGGVAEEARETSSSQKKNTVGPRSMAQHLQLTGSERYTQKSLGDAIFPTLEDALESEGLLRDISEEAKNLSEWTSGNLREIAPPGSLVRVTANGSLFDSRYSASVFAAFSSVVIGLEGLGVDLSSGQKTTPGKGKPGQQKSRSTNHGLSGENRQLEDTIPDFVGSGTNGQTLRAIIRIARGVFTPGLNINLSPVDSGEVMIGSRLQEGRQYLDSEPDILFARYGTEAQEWTVVGSVGSYGSEDTDMPDLEFVHADGSVNRGAFADGINALMKHLGGIGFVDLPQHPGFSLIPFAVYRTIPRNSKMPALWDR